MFAIFKRRLQARPMANRYPAERATLPPVVRGMPELRADRCTGRAACATVCPSGAVTVEQTPRGWTWALDRARCLTCGLCIAACPAEALTSSPEFELASRSRDALRTETIFISGVEAAR